MTQANPDQLLAETVKSLLRDGPRPIAVLLEQLDELDRLDYLRADDVIEDDMEEAVLDEVLMTDALWATADGVLALTAHLTEGLVLTHRLSASEIASNEVLVTPDLVVLDWDSRDGLDVVPVGRLVHSYSPLGLPGEDGSVFSGPEGWLDGFDENDVVAFTRSGATVTVWRADSVGEGDREVALLAAAVELRIPPGEGEEAVPLILDALVRDPDAFRVPVRPLGELLEAAGLERRGFSFGRSSQRWLSFSERHRERQRRELQRRWKFDPCCSDAFDRVTNALASFELEAVSGLEIEELARDLAHGAVAPACAEFVLGDRAGGNPVFAHFAEAILRGASQRQAAPAMLLSALEADRRGDALTAEELLRRALRIDAGYGPAALSLAEFEVDRGELRRALTLLHHPGLTPQGTVLEELEELEELLSELEAPYHGAGRNDPCPCSSGRKFKLCCQRQPKVALSMRTRLLTYKLVGYTGRSEHRARLAGVASSACDPDDPDLLASLASMVAAPVIRDFTIFEGGLAEHFLDDRGELLPTDERRLLEQLIDEPRRLWEVTQVEPGTSLTLRDTATGDLVRVAERQGSLGQVAGACMLARVARMDDQNQLIGVPVEIPLRLRESTLQLIDSHPDADALAAWYGRAIALPDLVNSEGERLLLCHTELATQSDLAALHGALDPMIEPDGESQWCERWAASDGEWVRRGIVRYGDGRLCVETNSLGRLERLVAMIQGAVPGL